MSIERDGKTQPGARHVTRVERLHSGAILVEYDGGHVVLFPAPRLGRFLDALKLLFRR